MLQARTIPEWLRRRAEIIGGMQAIMGRLPGNEKRCPPDLQIQAETDCGSYVEQVVSYASEPGSRVPAYLLVPKAAITGSEKAAAVLCLHPTDFTIGPAAVVGQAANPELHYAKELASLGFVCLAPAYPLLTEYQPDLDGLGWDSGTLKAVWDNMRGLDLLASLAFVDTARIGAIGHSLGGHNAVFTAVLDERIRAVVSSCGLDSFQDYYCGDDKMWVLGQGWTHAWYMSRLAGYRFRLEEIPFDFDELIGALAPRHVMIIAPLRDDNFQWDSVDRILASARPVYQLYGYPERLRVEHPDCGHEFPESMRLAAYQFLEDALR